LPAAAPLSILIGGLLAECDLERLRPWLRRATAGMTLVAIASAAIAALLWSGPPLALLIVGAAAVIIFGGRALWSQQWTAAGQCALIAVTLNAALFGAGLGMSAWRGAGIAGPMADEMMTHRADEPQRVVFAGEAAQVSQLRVSLGGETSVVAAASAERVQPTDLLVLAEERADAWDLSGRRVQVVSHGHHIPDADEVLRWLLRGDVNGLMQRIERRFVIAGARADVSGGTSQTVEVSGERAAQ
jgi:hypothetical protein